jgi:DHA2 family multidrug resistance protein
MTSLTRDWDFWEIFWPQVFRGIGLMLSIVPVTNTALGTLPPERMKNASGLFNLTRNLGGALGLAVINTALNDRLDLHLARLHEAVNWSRGVATETLAQIASRFPGSDGDAIALKQVTGLARQQAVVMSFADVFLMLTVLFVALAAMGVMMKKPVPMGAGAGGH